MNQFNLFKFLFRTSFVRSIAKKILLTLLLVTLLYIPAILNAHDNKFVHPHIAEQGYLLLPTGTMKSEIGRHLGNFRGENTCEQAKTGNKITAGTSDEDVYDANAGLCMDLLHPGGYIYGFRHHFYDPDINSINNGLCDNVGAYGQAIFYWYTAKQLYLDNKIEQAYWYIGRIAHLLADASVPAHVHRDPHPAADLWTGQIGDPDPYEQFMKIHHTEWNFRHAEYLKNSDPIPSNWSLEDLFSNIAQRTQYFPSDDKKGNTSNSGDWFIGWPSDPNNMRVDSDPFDSFICDPNIESIGTCILDSKTGCTIRDTDLYKMGNKLMPLAFHYTAALYKLFWREFHIDVDGDDTISVLTNTNFSGVGKIGGVSVTSWEWDFDYDGNPANFNGDPTGQTASHVYKNWGNKKIALKAYAEGHDPVIVTKDIFVQPYPINFSYPDGYESLHRHFSTPASPYVTQYTWDYGDGTPTENGRTQGHTYATSGYYTVRLTLTLDDNSTIQSEQGIFVGPGIRYIHGHTIYGEETWYSGGTYVVQGSITIAQGGKLTIEPGVIIKFARWFGIDVQGALKAEGTISSPIVFTALKDDTFAGDTNGDGEASSPQKGDWGNISFGSTSKENVISHAIVKYTGHSPGCYGCGPNIVPAISVNTSSLTISDSTITDNSAEGIKVYQSTPIITNNAINNNGRAAISLDTQSAGTTVISNTANGNGTNGISIDGGVLPSGITLSNNLPYMFNTGYPYGSPSVSEGSNLTIKPGAVLKFGGGSSFSISGTLKAEGTTDNPIVFTSINDDSNGGDTNGDGNGSTPQKGNWGGIYFNPQSKDNILSHAVIKYGGYTSGMYGWVPAISISTSSFTISDSTITDNSAEGIKIYSCDPVLENNLIKNNNRDGIAVEGPSSPIINKCTLTNQNNGISSSSSKPFTVMNSQILGNTSYGIFNSISSVTINATNNDWGDPSGPLDDSDDRASGGLYNPNGKGNRVSDHVNYFPWTGTIIDQTATPSGLSGTPGNGAINLAWNANTEAFLGGYKVYYGTSSGSYGTPKIIGNVSTYQLTGLNNGTPFFISLSSMNTVGAESAKSTEITVTPLYDIIKPTSTITQPGPNAFLSGTQYTITGTADDGQGTGVKKVEISTDGGNTWNLVTGTTTWSYIWPLPTNGTYTIKTRATDFADNQEIPGPGVTVTVTQDTTGPALAITSHSTGQHVKISTIILSGTATDSGRGDNGVAQVLVKGSRADNDSATGAGTAVWSKTLSLNPGANNFVIAASDASPNQNQTAQNIVLHYDPVETFQLSLKSGGWNLISLPIDPLDPHPATLFGPNLIAVYGWNALGRLYEVPTSVKSKTGYWVAVSQDTVLAVQGTRPADSRVSVKSGWNLVGPVGNQPVPTKPFVVAVYGWGWPPDYRYIVPADCQEGKGFWVAASQEGDIWANPQPVGFSFLAFGDSITYGTSSSSDGPATGYPKLLEQKLRSLYGNQIVSINAGVPGEDTYGGLDRFEGTLMSTNPDLVLLMEGINDHLFGRPFEEIEFNLRSMVNLALVYGKAVILATIPPVISNEYNDRLDQMNRIQAFNPRIYSIATDFHIPVAQVYEAITSVPGWEGILIDPLTANHPNDLGYQVVRDAFFTPVVGGIGANY